MTTVPLSFRQAKRVRNRIVRFRTSRNDDCSPVIPASEARPESDGWTARYLKKWFWWATHSRIKPLRDFAWLLRRHENGILAYFDLRIDNGATEAMNNNAKQVSHRAHGFRTPTTFSINLYHCLGKLPLPQTVHKFL